MFQNQRGFTLIEILITIVLLAIITSGLMAMFTTFSQSNGDPSVITQATELAQEKLDLIIADKENSARGFNYVTSAIYPAENPVPGFSGFNRSVNVIFVNTGALNATVAGPTNYKNIMVSVTSKTGTVTTSTLIGSY
ncbi:MAG: type II secretion system protein [Nitrospirae bacterium]|nr:type II secretion system protein [Nitrospirota bacterium]MBI3352369.1 type II secretion system protein [Nitrospirota bacterium]